MVCEVLKQARLSVLDFNTCQLETFWGSAVRRSAICAGPREPGSPPAAACQLPRLPSSSPTTTGKTGEGRTGGDARDHELQGLVLGDRLWRGRAAGFTWGEGR